jgi:uncharacterized membrane protein
MFQRLMFFVAGVDRATMLECPATDRMWATHIGFSLCLSFTVVFGIAYVATGYMIDQLAARIAISIVVAATVFMFDRALFQSDWFVQGAFHPDDGLSHAGGWRHVAGRFVRIATRLTISLGLAWVIALFLELAIFSDTISAKIERDRIAANRPAFDELTSYSAELDRQIAERSARLASLEQTLLGALAETAASDGVNALSDAKIGQKAKALADREAVLRAEIRQIEASIQQYATEMHAEELGQKLSASNSGRTGQGPRFEFAKRQKDVLETTLQSRQAELAQIAGREEALRKTEADRAAAAAQRDAESRAALVTKRDALRAQLDAARDELRQAEADKAARVAEFRREVMERSYVQARSDRADPLTRIAAYQELKNDPKDGRTITLFSWMTRFLVIFLEIVPVIAKIFFSPPSVYATRVRDDVRRARQRVLERAGTPEPSQAGAVSPGTLSGLIGGSLQPSTRVRIAAGRAPSPTSPGPNTSGAPPASPGPARQGRWDQVVGRRTAGATAAPERTSQERAPPQRPTPIKPDQIPPTELSAPSLRSGARRAEAAPSGELPAPASRRGDVGPSVAAPSGKAPMPQPAASQTTSTAPPQPARPGVPPIRPATSDRSAVPSPAVAGGENATDAVTTLIGMMSDELSATGVKR